MINHSFFITLVLSYNCYASCKLFNSPNPNKMKTTLLILVLILINVSCGTSNNPVSDAAKNKIESEIKVVVNKMYKGNEDVNVDMVIEPFLDSPEFVFLIHGYALSYKQLVDGIRPIFNTLLNQKVTIVDEKYAFLDESTVLYTTNCKLLEKFKDGHSSLNDPTAILYVFKKIEGNWKIIYGAESFVKQDVINSKSSK